MAKAMGVSRASLYYVATQDKKDWALKIRMEEILHEHPSYGSRRLSIALRISRPRAQRVMRIYGIKPYRRHGRKYRKSKTERHFPNLLLGIMPSYANHIWATDFTELALHGKKIYVSTIVDLFTRELMGLHVGTRKGAPLTVATLANALFHHPKPTIFHSDNGREYEAKVFIAMLERYGITISRSRPVAASVNVAQKYWPAPGLGNSTPVPAARLAVSAVLLMLPASVVLALLAARTWLAI